MTQEEFEKIKWPSVFEVHFKDGHVDRFVSDQGVVWDDGFDEPGQNEGRANISCYFSKKSASQKSFRAVQLWADEIAIIKNSQGKIVWQQIA